MPGSYTTVRTCARCQVTATVETHRRGYVPPVCARCHGLSFAAHLGPAEPVTGEPDWVVVDRLLHGVPVASTLVDRYAALRELDHLSAPRAAAVLGVSYRTVQRYRSRIRRSAPQPSTSTGE